MGVVYKAEDTKLNRSVALKFLRSDVLEDDEHKKRFLREAQAAASLNHPNICVIHEIDEAEGSSFIAMELVEGESVKQKITARPLKLDEAIDIVVQVAQGLQAAHEKGIVHRDIKSSNLIVTPQGQVKVMDFGLAQLAEQSRLTKTETILGTPAYMSPEQAQRLPTDHRADIWSLGVVIYEMVTGRLPFEGERQQAVLYAIAQEDPEPITALRAGLPMELEWIVGKAMAKSAEERYQHVEEMIVDLRGLSKKLESGKSTFLGPQPAARASQAGTQQPAAPLAPSEPVGLMRRLRLQQALFAVAALVALAVSFLYFRETPSEAPEAPLRRFTLTPPVDLDIGAAAGLAISPNGKHIAFTDAGPPGEGGLWIQDLDQQQPRPIEGAEGVLRPFWSPGSDFVGFAEFAQQELRKVSVQGGSAIPLCRIPGDLSYFRAAWSPDGKSIVFVGGDPHLLYEVPAGGGTPRPLNLPEQAGSPTESPTGAARWPHFLPSEAGARVLVFTSARANETTMVVHDLETGRREVLGPGTLPFYSPSGHLLYQPSFFIDEIWALPFSLDTLQATGEAFPIAQDSRLPTVSADQTLVYGYKPPPQRQLVWLDRQGEKTGEISSVEDDIRDPRPSPDGRLMAFRTNWDLWVWNLARGVKTRLTIGPKADLTPVWSPDGQQVAFSSDRAGSFDIFLKPADGGGEAKALVATSRSEWALDWSQDGKYLLYHTEGDLWHLERNEEGEWEAHPFLQTPFNNQWARFSPDGRYVAYTSDESGQWEIYVQLFPEGGRKTTVSTNGGWKPRWTKDGKELFYIEGTTLMAVPVSTDPSFSPGTPSRLFETPSLRERWDTQYDVSADGRRIVLAETVGEAPEPSIQVVQNWYEEFRDREQD